MKIKVKYFDDEMTKIGKIEQGDWIDLRAEETIEYEKDDYFLISLGVAMELPQGMEAHVVPRSSTFKKYGVIQTNHMGVIDNSYCGDDDKWFMPCYALRDGVINKNDRICQFRIIPTMDMYLDEEGNSVELEEVEMLGNENRDGYGSTGRD